MMTQLAPLIFAVAGFAGFIALVIVLTDNRTLNGIKSKTVGDGQHGTARWATKAEIQDSYALVPFQAAKWRRGRELPKKQGLIVGCVGTGKKVKALVESGDVHAMVTAASGAGKRRISCTPTSNTPAPAG